MNAPPVQYLTAADGYNIAYCVSGRGMPFVYMHPFGHIQNDWRSPATGPWLHALSERFRLVQYDCRGQGLSTRGLDEEACLDDFERDLEALVEHLDLRHLVMLGSFWFGHVAVRYSARHPERVAGLVLMHSRPRNEPSPSRELARKNWDVFLESLVTAPVWSAGQRLEAIENFRQSTTRSDWLLLEAIFAASDVSDLLPGLTIPVLVLHARNNNRFLQEDSSALTALIPHAQLSLIEGSSQLGEGASGVQAIDAFVNALPDRAATQDTGPRDSTSNSGRASLSHREVEVLRLLAAGRSNQQIADELVISLNTVRRHVSNVFDKTGAANRAQAAVYAKEQGLA